ncbi:hypothetical protein EPN18_01675 [bacterium]|nr:MAG: hypothetical protein EPN18_01675 [bacterium]
MSISDELMNRYYELLSLSPAEKIAQIKSGAKHPKEAKEELAFELTKRFHGKEDAQKALEGFRSLFGKKEVPTNIEEVSLECEAQSLWLAKLLVLAGLADTTSAASRLVTQGGVKVDNEKITNHKAELPVGKTYLIQAGKRFFKRVTLKKSTA